MCGDVVLESVVEFPQNLRCVFSRDCVVHVEIDYCFVEIAENLKALKIEFQN